MARMTGGRMGILVTVALLLLAGCGSPGAGNASHAPNVKHVTLWLDYTPWGAHVPIYVAASRGYFARAGLDVSIRSPANVSDPLKLVGDSSNTLGIGYMSDVVSAEAKGIPVESVGAMVQHHLNCIMTLRSSGITSPKQLAGKRIGAAETPADNVILNTVFQHAGVTGRVQRVNVNYDYVPALLSHHVNAIEGAYQVWERIQIEQAGHHVHVIQLQKWGVPDEYELVLLASHNMVDHQRATVQKFMTALTRAVNFSVAHPKEAVKTFLSDNPNYKSAKGRTLVSKSWRLLIPFVRPQGIRFGSQSGSRWAYLSSWMARTHLIPHRVPNRLLYTARFDR